MWATQLTLNNFRGFERLTLDLDRPVTVLVGVNGAGKSTVLRALGAQQGFILSVYNRRHELPAVTLDERDRKLGTTQSEVLTRMRHGSYRFGFRVWWEDPRDGWQGMFHASESAALFAQPGWPFLFLAGVRRHVDSANIRAQTPPSPDFPEALEEAIAAARAAEDAGAVSPSADYARFFEWFKEREDAENERRVASRDLNLQDPYLRAVREAVAALMPGFEGLRVQRTPRPCMVVKKDGAELRLDQLSDGERNLIALAGDLARRMVLGAHASTDPREIECVILIDEIEQHLHPAWQRAVIPSLRRAFPCAQFVVTTHSPQVVSSVPASAVWVLDGTGAYPMAGATEGRDTNALLREVFGVPERPQAQLDALRAVRVRIDAGELDAARAELDALALLLSEADDDVVALRMRMHVAEAAE